ncbi:dihydrolipoyl dehydrogenase [uncultured Desulfobulbus sp.]|uniref:dihydrolipoyl dehydrogenase n=1 Tax=uncultured Desulfobulbus sp. TaxID=239745 RepID=UPI0029C89309|nr:dihydrolipoyl dehydrogenase [uncultured Desulfobulbus sp.]
MPDPYDIVFLGGGPAGYQGAIRAAQLGAKVAVVEREFLGGVCLNWGCIPTKTVRASAEMGRMMSRAKEFGFSPVEAKPDIAAIIARKERVVNSLRGSIARLFLARKVVLLEGEGVMLSPHCIEVRLKDGTQKIEAKKIVIATGSRPTRLALFPQSPRIFTPDELLKNPVLPVHMVVVGGGAVGVEMAAIFRELGSQITIIEAQERLLPQEDGDIVSTLQSILTRRKIKVMCGVAVKTVMEIDGAYQVLLSNGSELVADTILVAVGRQRNTEKIGLEKLGVEMDHGRIVVNEYLQTSVPDLFAAGDVIGDWMLAHVAFAEGICAAENALGQGLDPGTPMDYRVVPRCVFSLPEYAAVGLSEEQAAASHPVKVAKFPFKALGMAQAMGELEGMVKIICHAQTDEILGAHILGAHAAECVAEVSLAMKAGLPSRMVMNTIHTHPTLTEAVQEVAQALHGQAIHMPPEAQFNE